MSGAAWAIPFPKDVEGANLDPTTIDLYIQDETACAVPWVAICGTEDNRAAPKAGSKFDADPTRSRARLTIDWRRRQVILYANASCTEQLFQGSKLCHAPRDLGDGNNLQASRGDACGCLRLQADVTQTDFYNYGFLGPLRNVGQVQNTFSFMPDARRKDVTFAGEGTAFPDIALIQGGRVEWGQESAAIWSAAIHQSVVDRTYNYSPPN